MHWNEDSKEKKQIILSLLPSQPLKKNIWLGKTVCVWGHSFLPIREFPCQDSSVKQHQYYITVLIKN